jgi:hypothetical protein
MRACVSTQPASVPRLPTATEKPRDQRGSELGWDLGNTPFAVVDGGQLRLGSATATTERKNALAAGLLERETTGSKHDANAIRDEPRSVRAKF